MSTRREVLKIGAGAAALLAAPAVPVAQPPVVHEDYAPFFAWYHRLDTLPRSERLLAHLEIRLCDQRLVEAIRSGLIDSARAREVKLLQAVFPGDTVMTAWSEDGDMLVAVAWEEDAAQLHLFGATRLHSGSTPMVWGVAENGVLSIRSATGV